MTQCGDPELRFEHETRIAMDTIVTITVYDQNKSKDKIQAAIAATFDSIRIIENITSNYLDSSEISTINSIAWQHEVKMSPLIEKIIQESIHISNLSHGAFDISIWPVLKLWNFNSSHPTLPNREQIFEKLGYVDYQKIKLHYQKISFLEQGMGIDLGGIAKGYAIDRAVEILRNMGMQELMVNAGGDLSFISGPITRGKRRVWIRHPREKSKLWGYFKLDTGSIATSGDYERFFINENTRYHHILDPATGYPANRCISVTVQAETATLADALSTAIFVMGPKKGLKFVENLENVETVILFENNGKIEYNVSNGLQSKLIVLNVTDLEEGLKRTIEWFKNHKDLRF